VEGVDVAVIDDHDLVAWALTAPGIAGSIPATFVGRGRPGRDRWWPV